MNKSVFLFERLVLPEMGDHKDRAQAIYSRFGAEVSLDVIEILSRAANQGKLEETLNILEKLPANQEDDSGQRKVLIMAYQNVG